MEAGTYGIKARYLGYDFTSEMIETPTIPHRELSRPHAQGSGAEPVSGPRRYLYSTGEDEGLSATGLNADSNDQGMVHFVVPEERAYYAVAIARP